jgi:hypothetical protein
MRWIVAALLVATVTSARNARADVPADYTGTPFKGSPKPIPGRINIVDYDMGGANVGFNTVHQNGDVACAGFDYRTDKPVPTLCKTSTMTGPYNDKPDEYTDGPMKGMFFPSATTADYYIGAVRPGDWVNVTVNVAKAGTYRISTTWTSAGGSIDAKISFNGMLKTEFKAPSTGGYHNWVPFPDFAMVDLDAGVQVMKFQSVVEHLNMDYLDFELVGGGGDDDGGGAIGTGGAGGAGGSPDQDSGSVITAGGGGTSAQGGSAGSEAPSGTAGNAIQGVDAPMGQSGSAPASSPSSTDTSGCACTVASRSSHAPIGVLCAALGAVAARARIRRRRLAAR